MFAIIQMRPLSFSTVSGLALIQSFAASLTLPSSESQIRYTKRSVNAQTQQELASVVSSNSTIFGPTSANWTNETERYMQNIKPQIQLSVRPGCEDDVKKIVSIFLLIATSILTPRRSNIVVIIISHSSQSAVATP